MQNEQIAVLLIVLILFESIINLQNTHVKFPDLKYFHGQQKNESFW